MTEITHLFIDLFYDGRQNQNQESNQIALMTDKIAKLILPEPTFCVFALFISASQ